MKVYACALALEVEHHYYTHRKIINMATNTEQGPSLDDILSQYALKTTDLNVKCPRETRNEIAVKLNDWKMIGHFLDFPAEKLTSIGRENDTQDLCKVVLLDSWSKREGEGASYLKLAIALHRRQRRDLVEFLCQQRARRRAVPAEMGSDHRSQQTTSSSTVKEAVANQTRTAGLEETFKCPCGECSLMVYLKSGCPKSCIPYLGMPVNLSLGDKRNLKYTLNKDTRRLCESFRDLSDSTCDSFIQQNITLDRLIRVATNHDKSLQLTSVQSMDEAFTVLAKNMSFFNHKLLANIIEKLGDKSDKQRLLRYSEEFNLYCKRKIFELDPGNWAGSENFPEVPEGRELFAVVVSDFMIQTLGDTEIIIEILADILDIQPAALHIHRIDRGSVILVFSVPNYIADEIFPLSQNKMLLLKAKGIMIFVPSILKPQNYESNRTPLIQPSCGGSGVGPFRSGLDSGYLSWTNTEAMSTSPGPSSHGLRMRTTDKDAQLTQGANVPTAKPGQSLFISGPPRQILEGLMEENLDLKKTTSNLTEKDPVSFSTDVTLTVPIPMMSHFPPSSYSPLPHQSGFSSSTSMAERNDLHDMSAEELKLECQHLRDENHQLQLKIIGVNELAKLFQDRSELVQVLKEKNKRLEIAVVRLEKRCANYDRMLESQKGANFPTAKPGQSPFIPGPSRQILEGLMKENSDLKKTVSNLTGKGAAGYLEAVKATQLEEVIDQQKQEIEFLKDQINQLTSTGITEEEGASSLGQLSSLPASVSDSGPLKQQVVRLQSAMKPFPDVRAAKQANEALQLQVTQLGTQLAEVNRQNTELRSQNRDLLWQLQQVKQQQQQSPRASAASGSERSS